MAKPVSIIGGYTGSVIRANERDFNFAIQQRQFAACKRQAYSLESLDASCAAAEKFDHINGGYDRLLLRVNIYNRLRHRVNTMAGSMRMTFAMAPMAESTHIATVSTNSADVSPGVIIIGSAVSAVFWTMKNPTPAAIQKPMTALITAWQIMTL